MWKGEGVSGCSELQCLIRQGLGNLAWANTTGEPRRAFGPRVDAVRRVRSAERALGLSVGSEDTGIAIGLKRPRTHYLERQTRGAAARTGSADGAHAHPMTETHNEVVSEC